MESAAKASGTDHRASVETSLSKNFLFQSMETYISRVTAAGQMTLPKKVRLSLGIDRAEYVEVAVVGRSVIIRRLREEEEFLKTIRLKVKKTGLTRAKLQEIVEESRVHTWKRRHATTLR